MYLLQNTQLRVAFDKNIMGTAELRVAFENILISKQYQHYAGQN